MEITYLGHSSFRIKGKEVTVVTDPYEFSMVGFKFPSVTGDIVTVSHDHGDHSKTELIKDVRRVIAGPGEYEIGGVSIIGLQTFHDGEKGKLRGKNTIYIIEIDDFRILHLGDLGHTLAESLVEKIGDIGILMVPVGGEFTIGAKEAVKVVSAITPNIIIPMHYQVPGLKKKGFSKLDGVEVFTKEMGLPVEKVSKISLKNFDLGEDQKVFVLEKK